MESRRWIATIVALFALVALSLGSRDAHAVDAKYLCTPSGSQCVSVTPTDWEFSPQRLASMNVQKARSHARPSVR
jgi:hypothetical protein